MATRRDSCGAKGDFSVSLNHSPRVTPFAQSYAVACPSRNRQSLASLSHSVVVTPRKPRLYHGSTGQHGTCRWSFIWRCRWRSISIDGVILRLLISPFPTLALGNSQKTEVLYPFHLCLELQGIP